MFVECIPRLFWNGPAANWAVAFGTLILAVVAVFQQWLQRLVVHPNLRMDVRVARPDAERTIFSDGTKVYYFRLAVTNTGKAAAHDVQVYVSQIHKRKADNQYALVDRFMPMPLIWAHTGISTKLILLPNMPPAYCDLGHISDPERKRYIGEELPGLTVNDTVFALEFEVKPFSKGYLLAPGSYRLRCKLAAANSKPRDYTLELTFDGSWTPDEEKMFSDGVGLRVLTN